MIEIAFSNSALKTGVDTYRNANGVLHTQTGFTRRYAQKVRILYRNAILITEAIPLWNLVFYRGNIVLFTWNSIARRFV